MHQLGYWRFRLGPLKTFSRTTWPTIENAENRLRIEKGALSNAFLKRIRMRFRGYPWLPVNHSARSSAGRIAQQDEPLCSALLMFSEFSRLTASRGREL